MRHNKNAIFRYSLFLVTIIMTASCAQPRVQPDTASAPQDLSAGDVLILSTSLAIPSDSPVLYFQAGKRVQKKDITAAAPYCRLEIQGAQQGQKQVSLGPQRFTIADVFYDDDAEGKGEQNAVTHITFRAGQAVGLKDLSCGWSRAATITRFPTGDEIGATLGEDFSIENQN